MDLFLSDIRRRPPHAGPRHRGLHHLRCDGRAAGAAASPQAQPGAAREGDADVHRRPRRSPRCAEPTGRNVAQLGEGFYQVMAQYGFMETAGRPAVLRGLAAAARPAGGGTPTTHDLFTSVGRRYRDRRRRGASGHAGLIRMARWRKRLFSFMTRNAQSATAFFAFRRTASWSWVPRSSSDAMTTRSRRAAQPRGARRAAATTPAVSASPCWRSARWAWCTATSAPARCTPCKRVLRARARRRADARERPRRALADLLVAHLRRLASSTSSSSCGPTTAARAASSRCSRCCCSAAADRRLGARRLLVLLGLFGAALLYGDGVITPAISVLARWRASSVATPRLRATASSRSRVRHPGRAVLRPAARHGAGSARVFGPRHGGVVHRHRRARAAEHRPRTRRCSRRSTRCTRSLSSSRTRRARLPGARRRSCWW